LGCFFIPRTNVFNIICAFHRLFMLFMDILCILALPNLLRNLNLQIMHKITYLCFAILFCFSFKGLSQSSEIQRVKVDFVGPMGYTRHLLLGFTSDDAASDGVDYGYDALLFDEFPDELNWIIENKRYIIQGVGAFNNTKYYPLGMFLTNSGEIKIALKTLENFDTAIDVYVYDSQLNTFTLINNSNYVKSLTKGEYLNRFYIAFTDDSALLRGMASNNSLSLSENDLSKTTLKYLMSTKELQIKTNTVMKLKNVSIYNILGKKLIGLQNINSNEFKIPLTNLKTSTPLVVSLVTEDGKQLNKQFIAH